MDGWRLNEKDYRIIWQKSSGVTKNVKRFAIKNSLRWQGWSDYLDFANLGEYG